MKWDLEDLALRYLDPESYHDISERVAKKRGEREAAVQRVLDELKGQFEAIGLHAEINGRPKHFYSIHKKMQKGRDFSTIYDLTAVRIVVDSVKDCYGALGIVHSIWKPLPGRFKDYIAMPKPNMYQSLHTTVVGPGGDPLEVQIRTLEMHRTSEYGIAAHWRYKEGAKGDSFEQKLTWLRSLLEWQNDMRDSRMFMENLKLDLFESQVFIFSPKATCSRCRRVPRRSTSPIRCIRASAIIAWARRSTARSCRSIRFEERRHRRGAGQQVQRATVARLALARQTSGAKHKIKQWFRKERKEENALLGQEMLEAELVHIGLRADSARGDVVEKIAGKLNYSTANDLYAAIGFGDANAASVAKRLKEELKVDNVVDIQTLPRPTSTRRVARNASAFASPASTTCWCGSRNAVRRCRAIRSWVS